MTGAGTARRPLRALRRLIAIAVFAFTGALIAPAGAQATAFPETWLADGNFHTYCLTASFTTSPNVAHNAMNYLANATDFSVSQDASCIAGTDVSWLQANLPAGTRGQAGCTAVHPNGDCSANDVFMDFPEIDAGANDAQDREKTAVHEVGHTVGLGHHANPPNPAHDCAMRSGDIMSFVDPLNIKWRTFHAHDISHINVAY